MINFDDRVRRKLVNGILDLMSENVNSIILYGSVARGEASDDSDIDIAVIVYKELDDDIYDRLSEFIANMNLECDSVFSVVDIDYDRYNSWNNVLPFYKNVKNEGVVLWKAA